MINIKNFHKIRQKYTKILIFCLFLTLLLQSITLVGNAVGIYRVSGYVTINDVPAPLNTQVKLFFSDGDEFDYTSETGYYQIDWDGDDGTHVYKTGEFYIWYEEEWHQPIDNESVFIIQGLFGYEINLAVVTLHNHPPIANDDTYEIEQDQVLIVPEADGVLSNDTDGDLDPLTAHLIDDPTYGELLLETTGAFTYTPDSGYFGRDSFTYHAYDGTDYSNTATVNITIAESIPSDNIPPIAYDDSYELEEKQKLTINEGEGVLINDIDPDDAPSPLLASLVDDATYGNLLLETTGAFTYTPNIGFYGLDTFTYQAYDGEEYSNIATVNITVFTTFQPPSNPSPSNQSTGISITPTLSWNSSDPDEEDIINYTVYFGTSSTPAEVSKNQTGTSYTAGTLAYQTTYYWYIVAWKDQNMLIGPLWHFTTRNPPSSPLSGGGDSNEPPIADASQSDTTGFIGEVVTFDGSQSTDDTGIVSYDWDFGDGTTGSGMITTHTYDTKGTYTVTLTIVDDEGADDDDTITVEILQPNHPPTPPMVTGPSTGHQNTMYAFTAVSTDIDGDDIQYTFSWGDTTTATTSYLPNGTIATKNHSWTHYGGYTITVTAFVGITESTPTIVTILIDVIPIEDVIVGYIVDDDSDDIFTIFENFLTGDTTNVEEENSSYLIDSDGDGKWDYVYIPEEGVTTYYEYLYDKYYDKIADKLATPGFEFIFILAGIAVLLLNIRRRNK